MSGYPRERIVSIVRFRVFSGGEQREPTPCQTTILARWKDGSARWVLLDFQASPPPAGAARFTLGWDNQPRKSEPRFPVRAVDNAPGEIQSGALAMGPADDALLRVGDRLAVRFTLVDDQGQRCRGVVESSVVEARGPVRSTLLLRGSFRRPDGSRFLGFRFRASLFAGLSKVFMEPHLLVDADSGVVQNIRELALELIPRTDLETIRLGGQTAEGEDTSVRLLQVDDQTCQFDGLTGTGSKAPGWAELTDSGGAVAVAVRDFWQQWPKSLESDGRKLKIGLFPSFSAGTFDHMQPWYKHQFLFQGDCYRLRTGQSRRWQIWLDIAGDGAALAQAANAPLVPAADPQQAIATGVWGQIAPAGGPDMRDYDLWAENLFVNGCLNSIAQQRDYGAMNWGDWWGERGCNWGKHEYEKQEKQISYRKTDTLQLRITILCALTTIYQQPEIADLPKTPSLPALCPNMNRALSARAR